jgi:hypothetical protein
MAWMDGKIGEVVGGDNTPIIARFSKNGSLVTANGQSYYYESASRGKIFSLVLAAWTTTVNAGNIAAAAAAATTQFALWNPLGSGKMLSLTKFGVWPISGTAPVPPVTHSALTTAPSIASVALTPIQCNNVGMAASSVARCMSSAAGAALTGGSALVYIRAADLYITAGAAANLQGGKVTEYIDGDIVLPPGTGWVPTWAAAGTTFLGGYSVSWEEITIP